MVDVNDNTNATVPNAANQEGDRKTKAIHPPSLSSVHTKCQAETVKHGEGGFYRR